MGLNRNQHFGHSNSKSGLGHKIVSGVATAVGAYNTAKEIYGLGRGLYTAGVGLSGMIGTGAEALAPYAPALLGAL